MPTKKLQVRETATLSQNTTEARALYDVGADGKPRPWRQHKTESAYMAMAYDEVDGRKAERMRECASWLQFKQTIEGRMKLHRANFCRVRLCPVCQWRRSLKLYGQMTRVMQHIEQTERKAFVFLTLTCRNCIPEDLPEAVEALMYAWKKFTGYTAVRAAVKGWYRGLEVTYNKKADTYHPHIHALLAVQPSYFTSRSYLSQAAITGLWQQALGVDYTPIVDVRRIHGTDSKAVSEATKYTCKPSDLLDYDDWSCTIANVAALDKALSGKRLIAFGGLLRAIHKLLNLDDAEDGDLIHAADDEGVVDDLAAVTYSYAWHTGYMQYYQE